MKTTEHVTLSYLLAQLSVAQQYGTGGTLLMIAAGNLPDLDGVTLLGGWRIYRTYHRVLGHGLPVTLFGPAALAWLGSGVWELGPFGPLWGWLQLALLVHLFSDVCFYRWPVQLLWPFSARACGFGLIRWNDLVPTILLYAATALCLTWPARALLAATTALAALALYVAWRAWRPRSRFGWSAWVTGDWALEHSRYWRWLTGDFVT